MRKKKKGRTKIEPNEKEQTGEKGIGKENERSMSTCTQVGTRSTSGTPVVTHGINCLKYSVAQGTQGTDRMFDFLVACYRTRCFVSLFWQRKMPMLIPTRLFQDTDAYPVYSSLNCKVTCE